MGRRRGLKARAFVNEEFINQTALHGFAHMSRSKHIFENVTW